MTRTAVLLLQMGGPDSLEAVEPFLRNIFCDRDIIRIGPALTQPLLARLIANRRARRVREQYRRIGGKSPLRQHTERQAAALEKLLGPDYRCFVAMRYWKPDTAEALESVRYQGFDRIIALSLYPHFSRATAGSSFNELTRALARCPERFPLGTIRDFHDHPLYVAALAERIEAALNDFSGQGPVELVFSAHGLPRSFIDAGDPYLEQIRTTVALVMRRFGAVRHHLAFQSRAGPARWLEPFTSDTVAGLAAKGVKRVLMVPISFVSDHIETLYEIDVEYAELARAAGIEDFRRTRSLNDSPLFIQCLAELVYAAA